VSGPVDNPVSPRQALSRERWQLLDRLIDVFELPMALLGLTWLALIVIEFTRGLSPFLESVSTAIWIMFVADFAAEVIVAPQRLEYLRRHWLVALSLALPVLRVFRLVRAWRSLAVLRAARGTRLVRLVASINRGMASLAATMGRRGFGYVITLTAVVTLAGAAGMHGFERHAGGLQTYSAAVWWTAMIMTTMGSEYWPKTAEGRMLCVLLSLYAFAVFGYVTATLASFFVDRDAARPDAAVAGAGGIEALRLEIMALRDEVRELRRRFKT
jgi:voltage-gated potassium channel